MTGFGTHDRELLAAASTRVAASGLIVGSAGNLGLRRDGRMLITPRGGDLAIQLEWVASVYDHAICAGTPRILSAEQLDEVVSHARELRYGLAEAGA